ncbi:MAG: hypothetical protein ACREJ0_25135 [Geminicoccaceae bacterium]
MQKSVNGILTVILCYILLPAGLYAQTDERTNAAILETSLAICDNEANGDEEADHPCKRYIEENIENHADTIKWLLGIIEDQESSSTQATSTLYRRDQTVQWILVSLAFMITIAASITKGYPKLMIWKIDFAMIPIVLGALSAAVTSVSVYYQFDVYRKLNQTVAYDLEELERNIHFAIFRHAASRDRDTGKIDQEAINEWLERFETIMQRYLERESGNGA